MQGSTGESVAAGFCRRRGEGEAKCWTRRGRADSALVIVVVVGGGGGGGGCSGGGGGGGWRSSSQSAGDRG